MKFSFRNIGIIKEADIETKGLTVLTGLNNTGKSFITKSIFSIIKTITESNTQTKIEQFELIQNSLVQIYQLTRQVTPANVSNLLFPTNITNQLTVIFSQSTLPVDNNFVLELINGYETLVNSKIEEVISQSYINTNLRVPTIRQAISVLFSNLRNQLTQVKSEDEKSKNFFEKQIIRRFFQSQISIAGGNEPLSIDVYDSEKHLLEIIINNNTVQDFKVHDIINFKDATLIETPTILQLAKFINSTIYAQAGPSSFTFNRRIVQQRVELPYHYFDLIEKLFLSASNITNDRFQELYENISKTINGKVIFNSQDSNFYYENSKGDQIKAFNIATGIKAFGIMQLLLTSDIINKMSILIIDEPEVHEHPQWEIKYAEIIVKLSKQGIPIIISSHSSYFIEAIIKFSKENEVEENLRLYFGEIGEDKMSHFRDVSKDPEPIFKALAKPMRDLFFN